jgi:hypothetical protein
MMINRIGKVRKRRLGQSRAPEELNRKMDEEVDSSKA